MKITNKAKLQQIVFNHSSDIGIKGFMNLYKKCTTKLYSFLVNYTTFSSDNPLFFTCNLFRNSFYVQF